MRLLPSNLIIMQGSTFNKPCRITRLDPDTGTEVPFDLTGYQIRGQIRWAATDTEPVAAFQSEVTNAVGGEFRFFLPADVSASIQLTGKNALETSEAFYDLEMYSATEVIRIAFGSVVFSPEITK